MFCPLTVPSPESSAASNPQASIFGGAQGIDALVSGRVQEFKMGPVKACKSALRSDPQKSVGGLRNALNNIPCGIIGRLPEARMIRREYACRVGIGGRRRLISQEKGRGRCRQRLRVWNDGE